MQQISLGRKSGIHFCENGELIAQRGISSGIFFKVRLSASNKYILHNVLCVCSMLLLRNKGCDEVQS